MVRAKQRNVVMRNVGVFCRFKKNVVRTFHRVESVVSAVCWIFVMSSCIFKKILTFKVTQIMFVYAERWKIQTHGGKVHVSGIDRIKHVWSFRFFVYDFLNSIAKCVHRSILKIGALICKNFDGVAKIVFTRKILLRHSFDARKIRILRLFFNVVDAILIHVDATFALIYKFDKMKCQIWSSALIKFDSSQSHVHERLQFCQFFSDVI